MLEIRISRIVLEEKMIVPKEEAHQRHGGQSHGRLRFFKGRQGIGAAGIDC